MSPESAGLLDEPWRRRRKHVDGTPGQASLKDLKENMDGTDLLARVESHYRSSEKPLLLSDFGKELREAGLWPIPGEERSMAEVIRNEAPGIALTPDPSSPAYVVVTRSDDLLRANRAINNRRRNRLLSHLPRPVLLSFVADTGNAQTVYLRSSPPYRYSHEPTHGEHWWPVEREFRRPGLRVDQVADLPENTAQELSDLVQRWAARHQIDLDELTARGPGPATHSSSKESRLPTSALERLHDAQAADVAGRLVVPMDIALYLSRIP